MTESHQTISTASFIGFAATGGAIVGFFLQLIVAHYFGASSQTDAYFMAVSTSEMLGKLLLGGSITAVFLPMFVERFTHNQHASAWNLAVTLINLTTGIMLALLLLIALFARPFVSFIAPGFSPETAALTINLLRLMLPAFLFLFLVDLITAILHSLRDFTVPALLRIITPTISIVTILLTVHRLGIYALALGTLLGSIIQLALVWWKASRHGFNYRFTCDPRGSGLGHLLYLVYPFIFSMLATQAAGITYRILASDLSTGSLSALKYAEKITQLLTIIFLNSVTTVIYPLLSTKAAQKDTFGFTQTTGSALRLTLLVAAPLAIGVAYLRQPFISLIYEHGSFSTDAALMTSTALGLLVIGLVTNTFSSIFGHAVLAIQKTRAAVLITIFSQLTAILLFITLVPRLQFAGLALASSLVPLSSALLYYLYLHRRVPELISIFHHSAYLKIIVLSGFLWLTLVLTSRITPSFSDSLITHNILAILIPTIMGCIVFFGGAYLWHIPEIHDIQRIVSQKVSKYSSRL